MNFKKIGIFDSGYGGLSVLRGLESTLPQYSYVYFGDNAFAPYGERFKKEVTERTVFALKYLFKKDCGLVIVACNTASALALRTIQQTWLKEKYPDRRVLGVLVPAIEDLCQIKKANKICVIGTQATCDSGAYEREYAKLKKTNINRIFTYPTPKLVPLIEDKNNTSAELKKTLKTYLDDIQKRSPNVLVLGCTHYPLIKGMIKAILFKDIKIIDPVESIGEKLAEYLSKHKTIKNKLAVSQETVFFTTGSVNSFYLKGKLFYKHLKPNMIKQA